MLLPTGCVLLRSIVRCLLWVVGKSGKRPREISRVRFAHEKTRIFGAHKCHPVMVLYGISLSQSFEGRVHDLGRRTKDGFSAFHALLGGRRTANGGRLLKKWSLSLFFGLLEQL